MRLKYADSIYISYNDFSHKALMRVMPFILSRSITAFRFQPLRRLSRTTENRTHGLQSIVSPNRLDARQNQRGRQERCLCGSGSSTEPLKYDNIDAEKRCILDRYLKFLLEENQKYNLTGIGSYEDAVEQLVNDSATLLPLIEDHVDGDIRLVDVGSGAGIPGIIFSILKPNWTICCIEATRKKSNFMTDAVALCRELPSPFFITQQSCFFDLELENVEIVNGRAEDIAHDPLHREVFDVVVCRGVGELRVISEYCLPFLKIEGLFVAPKGPNVQGEVIAAALALECLSSSVMKIEEVDSWGNLGQRTVVLIRKNNQTPRKFPRKSGKPHKHPL